MESVKKIRKRKSGNSYWKVTVELEDIGKWLVGSKKQKMKVKIAESEKAYNRK